jgi:hypothetical protein
MHEKAILAYHTTNPTITIVATQEYFYFSTEMMWSVAVLQSYV